MLTGKMGIAILIYRYARYTGSKIFKDYAGELITGIHEKKNPHTTVDFANILPCIDWEIEYLKRNGFIEAGTDKALAEIDNGFYQSSINQPFLFN